MSVLPWFNKLISVGYALDSQKFRRIERSDEARGNSDQQRVEDVNVSRRLKLKMERVPD
jgi:hypothetical protein